MADLPGSRNDAQGTVYHCRASGEGTSDVRICSSVEEVRAFAEEMFGPEGLDDTMKDFADPDHWCNDGFSEARYCADFEVWRVAADRAPRSESKALEVAGVPIKTVTLPLEIAKMVRRVCLPHNPNKCRGWDPEALAAVRTYIATVESADGK